MCYLATIIPTKKNKKLSEETQKAFLEIMVAKINANPHGFAMLTSAGQKIRTLNPKIFYKMIEKNIETDFDFMVFHARYATAGDMNYQNIHLWDIDGWHFGHNGWTGRNRTKNVKSDSLLFFEELAEKINTTDKKDDSITKAINETAISHNFTGRAMLLSPNNEKMYLFGDFEVYVLDDCIIISSATISFEYSVISYGLAFDKEIESLNQNIEGVYTFDFELSEFKFLANNAEHPKEYTNRTIDFNRSVGFGFDYDHNY